MKMPSLCNAYFDKLRLSPVNEYLTDLRQSFRASRDDLARITGLSAHTIRRYESEWKNSNPPSWYELLLRFMAGDLSFYGPEWADCRIFPHDRKLASPYFPHDRLTPQEMHLQYNTIHRITSARYSELNGENERLKHRIKALEAELETLRVKAELLEAENARLKAHQAGIKKGTVVPLFGQK